VAVALEVSVAGQKKLARLMSRLDPKRHGEQWQRAALLRAALLVQRVAAQKKIKRGGEGKPLPHVLTSRTGTLRRSIGVDRGPLPGAVDVGTALKYGGVHETGGVFGIPRHTVAAHARRMAFGRRVAAFNVGPFSRGPYSARFPKRPFLVPALEDIVPRLPDIFVEEIQKVLRAGA
jgi:phage gpG-like protein